MTMSEMRSTAEAAGVQLGETIPLHPDKVPEGTDDSNGGYAEQIWDQQELIDPSAGGMSALPQVPSLSEKEALDIPTTVHVAPKLIAQGLSAITENSVFIPP